MKKTLSISTLLLSFAFILAGCDTKEPSEQFNSKPITGATVDGAIVKVSQTKKEITVTYDTPQDLTAVSVKLTLANGVTMVSPEANPFTIDLRGETAKDITVKSAGKDVTYKIKANIDMTALFSGFTAKAENKYDAVVKVDHSKRTVELAFDATSANLDGVAVNYTLEEGVTVVAPEGKSWKLSTTTPTEFKLKKNDQEIIYTVTSTISLDLTNLITAFTAKVGSESAEVAIDNTTRNIALVFNNATDFTAVTVGYTLATNVTADKAAGTWDLSTATKETPLALKLTKLGTDVTYNVYITKYFTPAFRNENGEAQLGAPVDWERITDNISPDIALYKITQLNGGGAIVAYAIAAKVSDVNYKTIGEGYEDSAKPLSALAAGISNGVVISGGDQPQLLVVNGKVVNNTVGDDNTCMLVLNGNDLRKHGVTNRVDSEGYPCSAATDGATFGDKIFWWDLKTEFENVTSAGAIGAGILNWSARDLSGSGYFNHLGIPADLNDVDKLASISYGEADGVVYLFACESSANSEGVTDMTAMKTICLMGANNGGKGNISDRNTIGLYVNGKTFIKASDGGEYSPVGYAFSLTGK